jgi:hypothetical protein
LSLVPKDLTPVYKETIGKGAGAHRWQRPIYVDHLPPCNQACPAGENIQAWLALAQAGDYEGAADGLVLFNRFYAPDIDLTTLRVTRSLPLSTAAELPLSLVWIALLSRRVACSLAASRGVETETEVVKYLLTGADVVMTASALLRHGPPHIATMREGLEHWLGANGCGSVDAIRGLKDATHAEHVDALLRAHYGVAGRGARSPADVRMRCSSERDLPRRIGAREPTGRRECAKALNSLLAIRGYKEVVMVRRHPVVIALREFFWRTRTLEGIHGTDTQNDGRLVLVAQVADRGYRVGAVRAESAFESLVHRCSAGLTFAVKRSCSGAGGTP